MTTDGRWVHVICAVAMPEARFVCAIDREPVDVSAVPETRRSLKCLYCHKTTKGTRGACVQCSFENCSTSFHVTCAHIAGVLMKPADWPYVVSITCHKHKLTSQKSRTRSRELSLGQEVIGRHSNGKYYPCTIIGRADQTFYEVNYDDGSYSNNLYPENVASQDCLHDGAPEIGELILVYSIDGSVLNASFVREHIHKFYQVEFHDHTQMTLKRADLHSMEQELPKRVKARMSMGDAVQQAPAVWEDEAQSAKRPRLPSPPLAPATPLHPMDSATPHTSLESSLAPAVAPSTVDSPVFTPTPSLALPPTPAPVFGSFPDPALTSSSPCPPWPFPTAPGYASLMHSQSQGHYPRDDDCSPML